MNEQRVQTLELEYATILYMYIAAQPPRERTNNHIMYLERARARLQTAAETESEAKAQLAKATSARVALEKDVEQAEVLLE
eukprot:5573543-Pyramimonas_sp.AAC.1